VKVTVLLALVRTPLGASVPSEQVNPRSTDAGSEGRAWRGPEDDIRDFLIAPHVACAHAGYATVSPDYKTQAGVLLSNQPPRQSTRRDPTTLADYLSTLSPRY
jgi:hypothetical protein